MNNTFKLLLIVAFINALSWIIITPVFQYPDEQSHFAQVQNMAEFGTSKNLGLSNTSLEISVAEKIFKTSRDGLGNNSYTYHPEFKIKYSDSLIGPQEYLLRNLPKSTRTRLFKWEATDNPPVYYLFTAASYKLFYNSSLIERVFASRLTSLVFFILNIIVAYKIAKIFFKKDYEAISLSAIIAFKPMLIHASTGVLPDSLTNLLFSTILLIGLKILKEGIKIQFVFIAIVIAIIGFYTRQQFLIAVPMIILAIAIKFFQKEKLKKLTVVIIFLLTTIVLLKIFPLFNYFKRIGIPELINFDLSDIISKNFVIHFKTSLQKVYAQTLPWYWGVYKWLSFTQPHILYQIINRVILIGIVGLFIHFVSTIKNKWNGKDILLAYLIICSLFYFIILLIWEFYFNNIYGYLFGFQGRYYFPLVIAHMIILVYGVKEFIKIFTKNNTKYIFVVLSFLMIVFNNISLWNLIGSYYDFSSVKVFLIQVSQYKPNIIKGYPIMGLLFTNLTLQIILLYRIAKSYNINNESK